MNPVPTLPETAINLFEEVGEKTFCTALAVGDHLVTINPKRQQLSTMVFQPLLSNEQSLKIQHTTKEGDSTVKNENKECLENWKLV